MEGTSAQEVSGVPPGPHPGPWRIVPRPVFWEIGNLPTSTASNLIVMSTHVRTGFDRAFFGSVADKVVRGASGPVMVIPPQRQRPTGGTAELVAAGEEA